MAAAHQEVIGAAAAETILEAAIGDVEKASCEEPAVGTQAAGQANAAAGDTQGGPALPGLRHARTSQLVSTVQRRGANLMCQQSLLGLVLVALAAICFWAWDTAEETCVSRPIMLKDWFLGTAICETIVAVTFFFMLCSMCRLMNPHIVKANIYRHEGRDEEAAIEEKAGALAGASGVLGMLMGSCVIFTVGLFTLPWSILGFISALHAHSDTNQEACDTERRLYWGIFVTMIILNCCCQCANQAQTHRGGMQ